MTRPLAQMPARMLALLTGAALLIAAGVVAALVFAGTWHPTPADRAFDLHGNTVQLDPGTIPPAPVRKQMNVQNSTGERFQAPSVGLDVAIGALNEAGGQITPPGFTEAYLVRNKGVTVTDATNGTVYVVMHSLRGGGVGPGNYLIDVAHQTARIKVGATITIDGTNWKVDSANAVPKAELPNDADIWNNEPGRLVIITCLQRPSGAPSKDNMVITAALDEGAAP